MGSILPRCTGPCTLAVRDDGWAMEAAEDEPSGIDREAAGGETEPPGKSRARASVRRRGRAAIRKAKIVVSATLFCAWVSCITTIALIRAFVEVAVEAFLDD
jgi:hypothetical protein